MRRLVVGVFALAVGVALIRAQPEDGTDLIHTVAAGDTLISIAHAYGVTLDQLLTLNDLHPEALLQIGQRLLVIRAPAFADDDSASDEVAEDVEEAEIALGGNVESGDLPPAPVADADAPMRDPADITPQLCVTVFNDGNRNGMIEAGELMLRDATIRVLDAADSEQMRYTTDGADEPYCARQLGRQLYTVEGSAPPGFGLTGASRLRVDLRSGGTVLVEFGAKQGLQEALVPPPDRTSGESGREGEEPRSLLRELSGLFALSLAAVVFVSGMAVSVFIRWR